MNNEVQYLEHNTLGRDLVVGDIHGCLDEFQTMLEMLNFDPARDRVISVGDLVDRGPKSFECLQLLQNDWFFCTKGNHEDMMIETIVYRDGGMQDSWLINGGDWSDNYTRGMNIDKWARVRERKQCWSTEPDQQLLYNLCLKAEQLPLIIVVGKGTKTRYNVVHAEILKHPGIVTDDSIDKWNFSPGDINGFMWGRGLIKKAPTAAGLHATGQGYDMSLTYVGHTPQRQPTWAGRQVYLDTGAVYHYVGSKSETNALTIADPIAKKIHIYSMTWRTLTTKDLSEIRQFATK